MGRETISLRSGRTASLGWYPGSTSERENSSGQAGSTPARRITTVGVPRKPCSFRGSCVSEMPRARTKCCPRCCPRDSAIHWRRRDGPRLRRARAMRASRTAPFKAEYLGSRDRRRATWTNSDPYGGLERRHEDCGSYGVKDPRLVLVHGGLMTAGLHLIRTSLVPHKYPNLVAFDQS